MKDIISRIILAAPTENPNFGFFISIGDNSPADVIMWAVTFILSIAGVVSTLFIIIGGFQYMTSGLNEDLAKQGKRRITSAIIGLIIIVLSYTIISVINRTFNVSQ